MQRDGILGRHSQFLTEQKDAVQRRFERLQQGGKILADGLNAGLGAVETLTLTTGVPRAALREFNSWTGPIGAAVELGLDGHRVLHEVRTQGKPLDVAVAGALGRRVPSTVGGAIGGGAGVLAAGAPGLVAGKITGGILSDLAFGEQAGGLVETSYAAGRREVLDELAARKEAFQRRFGRR